MTKSFIARASGSGLPKRINNIRPRLRHALARIALAFRRDEGSVAVEFAILGPILAIGLLYLSLLATKIHRYIAFEQIARAGVEAAVSDPGMEVVLETMRAATTAKGFLARTVGDDGPVPQDPVFLTAARNCSCPGEEGVTSCTQVCPDTGRPPFVRYFIMVRQDFTVRDNSIFFGLIMLGDRNPFISWNFIRKSVLVR